MHPPLRQSTLAEAEFERILNALGNGALRGEFVREWPVGHWLLDFYFASIKLAIEVDGGYHRAPLQWRRDLHKTAELESLGITVLRLTNAEVFGDRERLIVKLRAAWRVAQAQVLVCNNAKSPPRRHQVREPASAGYAVASVAPAALIAGLDAAAIHLIAGVESKMNVIESLFATELARLKRRTVSSALFLGLSTGLGTGLATLAAPAFAQTDVAVYPNRPLRIIVNFPPGGTADVLTRAVSQALTDKWSQAIVVENRAGAGGNIGAQAVAAAAPDGYTLLATPPGPLTINQNLYRELGYDAQKFVPVILLASVPNAITARPDLPANSVKDLIAHARAHPGKLTYASQGNGSTSHLTGQMFASMTGVEMVHVPFKGEGPALVELLAGRVDLFFGNISAVLKFREGNRVKLLGLAAPRRGSMAPDVPTVAEGGVADFAASAWFAFAAPAGTPPAIAQKINAAVAEVLKQPDVQRKFAAQGAEVTGGTPAEMASFLDAERARWKKVIDTARVTLD